MPSRPARPISYNVQSEVERVSLSCYLNVIFKVLRGGEVDDGANVEFVDAHTESNRCTQNNDFVIHETALHGGTDFLVQTGMVTGTHER